MNIDQKPLDEVMRQALDVLNRELGPADTLRFIRHFAVGHGDYTAERDALFGHLTFEELTEELLAEEAAMDRRK